ncbi:winged helix DNA-binding domain-containing protein [Neocallimastix californiae]|uniref:Winged helix DNA-binding domain-containing protein n=1 Tax=Neocallimastix californiae TaxID=1754190 RepID=A0A1Y2FB22_9FUNG|nr:winged helix DNA-binding domain-containing protein [Neocallimastix californiae]|eukprot:ORY81122.1 winged helix DNA-binding domain-containing protein [Neocallimastix californiae]
MSGNNHDNTLKYQEFQKQNFIGKLIEMLNNPEISDLISWNEDKISVIIKNINEFSGRALPMYFKHNKFNSFTRQLNTYGFSYKKIDDQTFKFQNENFIENKPELLKYISKKKNKNDEDIQSLQIELNDLKLSHGQLQREYNSLRQVMERMRMENNELRMMNKKLQNQVDDLQKMNNDIDLKYNNMKVKNGKIYYNLVSILENLKVENNIGYLDKKRKYVA